MEDSVKLLGSYIGDYKLAVSKRLEAANVAFRSLYKKLWMTQVSLKTKVKVFQAICLSTLMYGLDSLPLSNSRSHCLNTFAYRSLRKIFRIKYDDHISYSDLSSLVKDKTGIEFKWPVDILKERRSSVFWDYAKKYYDIYSWTHPA